MIQFYGYKKCGTSRKAEKALTEAGIKYEFTDITLNPPSEQELDTIIKAAAIPYKKGLNTSGVMYRELKLKDKVKTMTDEELLKLIASDGKLCKRPMLIDGAKATVGFKEETFQETWGV